MIAFAGRSYRVGDLMKAMPATARMGKHRKSDLVLIIREAGHPRYFYGLHCGSGKEELLCLENYLGVHEFDGCFPLYKNF
tara:strand:- start:145 stop:384 length:240 start_codon:yes stop_codon:yes gene_type:complete